MDAITQAGWRPLERDGRIQKLEAVMRDENATTNERFSASRLITNLSRKLNRKGDVEKTPLIWSDDSQVADVKVQKFYLGKLEKATGVRVTVTRMQDPEPSLLAVNGNAMAGVMNV